MTDDPFRVYREAGEQKRQFLSSLWPELNDVLKRAMEDAKIEPPQCSKLHLEVTPGAPRPLSVGRESLNGHPVCQRHLGDRRAYPLKRVDPRNWKDS